MSNYSQNGDDYERQMAQRRKQNRNVVLGIGAVILIALAFSPIPGAWAYVLAIFVVVAGLLYARSVVERRYKAAAERERIKREAILDQKKDEPKE